MNKQSDLQLGQAGRDGMEEEEAQTEVVMAVDSGILECGDKSWDAGRSAVLSLRTLVKGQSFSEMQKSDAAEQRGDS